MASTNPEIILKRVRLSFPTLWTPQEFKVGDGKPRWSATFLVDPGSENDKLIRQAIEDAAKVEWPKDWKRKLEGVEGNSNKYCYIDGNKKDYDGYAGVWALASHRAARTKTGANTAPLIINRDKTTLTEKDGKPYAGCYVNAKVAFYAQSGENPGLRCSFSVVQFAKDGDAFSTSVPKADDMEDLSVTEGEDIADMC